MQINVVCFTVHKRFPLTISRGTTAKTTSLWVKLEAEGIEGWGEAVPFSTGSAGETTETLKQQLTAIKPNLEQFHPLTRSRLQSYLQEHQISSAIRSAIDVACYDWLGKRSRLPLWQLLGLDISQIVPISVTIGIGSPEEGKKRLENWQTVTDTKRIKLKLGSPKGLEADKRLLEAVAQNAPNAELTIDANGGWTLKEAITMSHWLAKYNVTYIEQPLAVEDDEKLPTLADNSPLPIFADESCFTSKDISRLAALKVDGINIKLMKAGGLTEVMRCAYTAQACGLQVMYGCYSDSSLANTAMAHLSPLADYLDLDSHLNLKDDPFYGAVLKNGYLQPTLSPGLGITLKCS
ncbi:dipeptide epimerase [Euhalothece natronophila Z-M001]|uniref:Dipeptide epimerase n=1 Tax=Euhalothece natronophila Z-M001 TaxID=522448 RepID=A0A5B8NM87_9CHRO|nr:dipeptide epimerase [Euhalothece natronophila]QDZ40154.1 dipeptide epimerase [Euhalothece natronophila Z-M001]